MTNIALLWYADEFAELVERCSKLETQLTFCPDAEKKMVSLAWMVVTVQAIFGAVNFAFNCINDFGMAFFAGIPNHPRDTYVASIIFSFLFIVHMGCISHIDRMWIVFFARAFRLHLESMTQVLRVCVHSRTIPLERKIRTIAEHRVLLSEMRGNIDLVNKVLGLPLLYTYSYVVVTDCMALFFVFSQDTSIQIKTSFGGFSVLHTLSFLLPAYVVSGIENELWEMRNVLQSFEFSDTKSNKLLEQVRLLLMDAEYGSITFSAGTFFDINLPRCASIIGAVVAYTVFLVQTAEIFVTTEHEGCNP